MLDHIDILTTDDRLTTSERSALTELVDAYRALIARQEELRHKRQLAGRKGGQARSPRKTEAVRANAKLPRSRKQYE
jgi:hypothetical protein